MRSVGFYVVGFFCIFCFVIFTPENIAGLSFMGVKQEAAPSPVGFMQIATVV